MKKLRFFGLLAMIALLAFGLALSCDSSTPAAEEPGSPAPVAHYSLDGGRLGLYFSQDPSRLPRATGTSAEEGDHYVLIEELSRRVLSAGTATVGGVNGNAITLNPNPTDFPDQEPFSAEVSSDGGISMVGAPDGAGGTIGTPITGEREGSGAYQPGGNQGGSGGNGGQPVASKYTVTFINQGATYHTINNVSEGGKVTLPTPPTRTDYEFLGWYSYSIGWFDGDTPVTANISVTAQWQLDPQLQIWSAIAAANAALIVEQVTNPGDYTAEIEALKGAVLDAFKDADIKNWVSAGPLSTVYEQDKGASDGAGGFKTHLYYVDSKLDDPNTIELDNKPDAVVVGAYTLNGSKQTTTLTYGIGSNPATDKVVYGLEFWPIAEYEVVLEAGATGTVKIKDNGPGNNGDTFTNVPGSCIGALGPTVITVTIPAGMMVTVVDDDGNSVGVLRNAQTNATINFNAASKAYTITVGSLGYTVNFDLRLEGDVIAIPATDPDPVKVAPGGIVGAANMPANPKRGGYTFGGWTTAANGTGGDFSATTVVNADTTVYAKWTAVTDANPPWGDLKEKNDLIKTMTAGDAKTASVAAMKILVEDAFWNARDPAVANSIRTWFSDTQIVGGEPYAITDYEGKGVTLGYLNSLVTGTGAARKITTTTKLPAEVTIGSYQLLATPTESIGDLARPNLSYVIGNNDDVVNFGLIFYPTSYFTVDLAGISGVTITIGETAAVSVLNPSNDGTAVPFDSTKAYSSVRVDIGGVEIKVPTGHKVTIAGPGITNVNHPAKDDNTGTDSSTYPFIYTFPQQSAAYTVTLGLDPP